jgi:hypothetical protein
MKPPDWRLFIEVSTHYIFANYEALILVAHQRRRSGIQRGAARKSADQFASVDLLSLALSMTACPITAVSNRLSNARRTIQPYNHLI